MQTVKYTLPDPAKTAVNTATGHATFEGERHNTDVGNIQFSYLRYSKVSPFFRLRV